MDFGNGLQNITYLPTNFEMELTILSEEHGKIVYLTVAKSGIVNICRVIKYTKINVVHQ